MKKTEINKDTPACNCNPVTYSEIAGVVDDVISITGGEPDKLIMILQEVQKRLNFLPSEALRYICNVTDITARADFRSLHILFPVQAYPFREAYN